MEEELEALRQRVALLEVSAVDLAATTFCLTMLGQVLPKDICIGTRAKIDDGLSRFGETIASNPKLEVAIRRMAALLFPV